MLNFEEHLFWKIPANGCFCIFSGQYQPVKKFASTIYESLILFEYVRTKQKKQKKEMLLIRLQN